MNRPIYVGLITGKTHCVIVALSWLVLAGRAFNSSAQTVTSLYSFCQGCADGNIPAAELIQGSDGNFYGTTAFGGTNGCGTVFRISSDGNYTSLHSFTGPPKDGDQPTTALVEGQDGNFYGTTPYGGKGSDCGLGCGVVYRMTPSGSVTNLHSFAIASDEGGQPGGALVQGNDGNFYGTTFNGGSSHFGTVFRISPSGSYTDLYSFVGPPNDGANPSAGLTQSSDGSFYGTTASGGLNDTGTVFRITPCGDYTNFYSFIGPPSDGTKPRTKLVPGSDGNFYGTTYEGGTSTNCSSGCGTVFQITASGSYTSLYSFGSSLNDGTHPYAGLMQGSDGNLYGTTIGGGSSDAGTVFRISLSGTCTILYSFGRPQNSIPGPFGGLVQGSDGNFYGTTESGGTDLAGDVFEIIIPLNPPANQISGIRVAGGNHVVTIPSVASETYQLQFSSSMTPTNWVNVPGVSVTNSIGALLTVTNFGGAVGPQGFYRFDITP